MAPKRKLAQTDRISRSTANRRISKRLKGVFSDEEENTNNYTISKTREITKKTRNKKYNLKEIDPIHNEEDVESNNIEQNPTSMSIDSLHNDSSAEPISISIDDMPISSVANTRIQSSTRYRIDTSDDDDEFSAAFQSTTTQLKNNANYISTPISYSKQYSRNVHASVDSISPYVMKDISQSQLSKYNNDQPSKNSDINNKNINSTRSHQINTVPQSQTPSSIRSLSHVPTPSNNSAILETFLEYRELKRDYEREVKKNERWAVDYRVLLCRMKKLEQTTFPRPSSDGRAFLEQLLHSLTTSELEIDTRSNAQLALDLRISEATLMSTSTTDPQKTSLRLFSALFPTNKEKEDLESALSITIKYPNLLETILVFARRCSPGSGYTLTMLKEAVGNSIRCARHKAKVSNTQLLAAVTVAQSQRNDAIGDMASMSGNDIFFG